MNAARDILEREIATLQAWGVFYEYVSEASFRRAEELEQLLTALDAEYPGWRECRRPGEHKRCDRCISALPSARKV